MQAAQQRSLHCLMLSACLMRLLHKPLQVHALHALLPCRRGGKVQLMAVPMPDSDYYNQEKGALCPLCLPRCLRCACCAASALCRMRLPLCLVCMLQPPLRLRCAAGCAAGMQAARGSHLLAVQQPYCPTPRLYCRGRAVRL